MIIINSPACHIKSLKTHQMQFRWLLVQVDHNKFRVFTAFNNITNVTNMWITILILHWSNQLCCRKYKIMDMQPLSHIKSGGKEKGNNKMGILISMSQKKRGIITKPSIHFNVLKICKQIKQKRMNFYSINSRLTQQNWTFT